MAAPGVDDHETRLVASAAQGNAAAFTELFHRYHPMIHAFAYRLCLENGHAQDIAQETFIKAARALGTFRGESSFKAWLYRIATNASRDHGRKLLRERKLTESWSAAAGLVSAERPADFAPVEQALGSLADDLRQAVVLVYFEDMTHAEAARILGCAEATVSWRIFMAKRKLKRLLGPPQI